MPDANPPNGTTEENDPRDGFYARQFTPAELKDLVANANLDMNDEINLLKVAIRRFTDEAFACIDSFEEWIKFLSTLTTSAARLDRLVASQRKINAGQQADNSLHKALNELLARIKPGIEEEDLI